VGPLLLLLLLLLLGGAALCVHVVCNDADCHWVVFHEVLEDETQATSQQAASNKQQEASESAYVHVWKYDICRPLRSQATCC
jgi:hypothetical protein